MTLHGECTCSCGFGYSSIIDNAAISAGDRFQEDIAGSRAGQVGIQRDDATVNCYGACYRKGAGHRDIGSVSGLADSKCTDR